MPHFFNDILVVTYDELVPEFYKSVAVVSGKCARDERKGYGLKRVSGKGGGGHVVLLAYDSLPIEIQAALGDPRKTEHILERYYKTDNQAVEFYQKFKFDDYSYLADDVQTKYITNASMLKAVIDLKIAREHEIISKGFIPKKIYETLCEDAISFNAILKKRYDVEHTLPEHHLRFKETFQKFQKDGYKSLISLKHKNKNSAKVDEHVVALLNNIFCDVSAKPTPTEVARQYDAFLDGYLDVVNKETGESYEAAGFPRLSENTVRIYINTWENKIGTYAKRSGNRQKLMQQFIPAHSMKHTKYAGSIISVDDRQPPFWYNENRNRVWFYMGIDLGSEAWTVWVNDTNKQGMILNFYRQMVRNYYEWGFNLPLELECESSLNSDLKEGLLMPGRMFTDVRIEANNARAKKIERYFGKLRYQEEKKHAGWLGRPSALSEANQPSPLSLKAEKVQMKSYKEIVELSLSDVEKWNNSEHSKHPGKTRWEVFCEMQNPATKPINWRGILPYIGWETKSTCNTGIIKLQSSEWLLGDCGEIYFGENLIKLLVQCEGQNVDMYWLDDNEGNVMKALVYMGNQYICEALPKPMHSRAKVEQTDEDLRNFEIMSKYVATINGYMNKSMKLIDGLLIIGEKPRTLNNKFKINKQKNEDVEIESRIASDFENEAIKEVETLAMPDYEDELDYMKGMATVNKGLFDRY
jgi:hypothetical protein